MAGGRDLGSERHRSMGQEMTLAVFHTTVHEAHMWASPMSVMIVPKHLAI